MSIAFFNIEITLFAFRSSPDFLTSFKCQASIIENRLIDFYGEEKSFRILTDIQNYLAANFSSEMEEIAEFSNFRIFPFILL